MIVCICVYAYVYVYGAIRSVTKTMIFLRVFL
jgi:hypothetical protein